jgi:hypothetical protein
MAVALPVVSVYRDPERQRFPVPCDDVRGDFMRGKDVRASPVSRSGARSARSAHASGTEGAPSRLAIALRVLEYGVVRPPDTPIALSKGEDFDRPCGPRQSLIAGGERRVADQGERQEMQIDPAEPLPHQPMALHELEHLPVLNHRGSR